MPIVGLDLSLSATGVATDTGERIVKAPAGDDIIGRCITLAARIRDAAGDGPKVFVIEDLPSARLAGAGSSVKSLGIMHGVVRLTLRQVGHTEMLVQPATLKKYATGKGNASKGEVLAAAIRRLGYGGADHNEADALWLRAIGHALFGEPLVELPAVHRAALDSIERAA